VFAKSSKEKQIPVKHYWREEDELPKEQTTSVSQRLVSMIKIVCKGVAGTEIIEKLFMTLVRFISHPLVSPTAKIMKKNYIIIKDSLKLEEGKFESYF